MISGCFEPVPFSALNFIKRLIRNVDEGGTWVCSNGFSVWKISKKQKLAQVVADDSEINKTLKDSLLQNGWSVLERELK